MAEELQSNILSSSSIETYQEASLRNLYTAKRSHEVGAYIVVYFIIAFSGIPFFDANKELRAIFLLVLIGISLLKKQIIGTRIIVLILSFGFIILFQSVRWTGTAYSSITSIGLTILIPYFALKYLGPSYLKYIVNILFIYSVISLIFWGGTNFINGFHELTYDMATALKPYTPWEYTESFILYTYEEATEYGFYRNPGPFHEPGAFGVFLLLGIIFNTIRKQSIFNSKNIVFILALLTTFSTASYLGLFVFFLSNNLFIVRKNWLLSGIFIGVIVGISIYSYSRLEFMGEKIDSQYENQSKAELSSPTSGRIMGARKALVVISRYPITGRGYLAVSKADYTSEEGAGYGWITWISRIGVPLSIVYFLFFYRSLRDLSTLNGYIPKFGMVAFISLLVVLTGQRHISSNLFFMIFLTSYIYNIRRSYIENSKENKLLKSAI